MDHDPERSGSTERWEQRKTMISGKRRAEKQTLEEGRRNKVKKLQFLPCGRSIGLWICLTHKTYTCHTVQNTYSASMAVSDSQ
jgi:hypothetical protein